MNTALAVKAPVAAVETSELRACPKCGRERAAVERSCARCGLMVAWWRQFSAENREPLEVAPLWEACVVAWGSPGAHDRLLGAATDLGLLPYVARRYKARLDADGCDAESAARLKQICVLVETKARAQAAPRAPSRVTRVLWMAAYSVATVVLTASILLITRGVHVR